MNNNKRRFFPLQRKSIVTPPARKVISKPEIFIVNCQISGREEMVNLSPLSDFFNKRFGTSFSFGNRVPIDSLRMLWDDLRTMLSLHVDNISRSNNIDNMSIEFYFKEKQSTPGIRIMKFSKKSRFYKENTCKTN